MITPNEGQRPSHLELDRYATGELDADRARALEARLDDPARAHLAALREHRGRMPPLDLSALRARAAALPLEAPAVPTPANDARAFRWLAPALVLLAAALLGVVLLAGPWTGTAPEGSGVTFRAGDALQVYQLQGRQLFPYAPGTPVGEGDVLGFEVHATGHRGVVLMSVDGDGTVSVFYPETGQAAEPIAGDGFVRLPDSIVLDDAPGPEVFVAVFDRPVSAARGELERAWDAGGAAAVSDWAERSAGVDAVEVTRR